MTVTMIIMMFMIHDADADVSGGRVAREEFGDSVAGTLIIFISSS